MVPVVFPVFFLCWVVTGLNYLLQKCHRVFLLLKIVWNVLGCKLFWIVPHRFRLILDVIFKSEHVLDRVTVVVG